MAGSSQLSTSHKCADPPVSERPIESKRVQDEDLFNLKVPHWRLVFGLSHSEDLIIEERYCGSGRNDSHVVRFLAHDPINPHCFPQWKKWGITGFMAMATLAVAVASTAYSGCLAQIVHHFGCSQEIATLGISLFVLGFALGPLLWGPLSELYGRRWVFIGTYILFTATNIGGACANSIPALIVLRFLAGTFGGSSLTNSGAVVSDLLDASQRSIGMSLFASAPFLGIVIGPVVGGFVGEAVGWRLVEGIMAIFSGIILICGVLAIPETYGPVLLQRRANMLKRRTGQRYAAAAETKQEHTSAVGLFKKTLSRPWALLWYEPVVLVLSVYMAIIYGTLFMAFGAFPIVFQEMRGWSQGIGGLAFTGIAIGTLSAVAYSIIDNKRFVRAQQRYEGQTPPEARLPPALLAAVCLPTGLLWFAWTNDPSIHWSVCIAGTAVFGFGMLLAFLSLMNYLVDSYTIYAASVLAANTAIRSLFGAIFPLFTNQMYRRLGIHWASALPGFLALLFAPFPFILYKYGAKIRTRCKYAAEVHKTMQPLQKPVEE